MNVIIVDELRILTMKQGRRRKVKLSVSISCYRISSVPTWYKARGQPNRVWIFSNCYIILLSEMRPDIYVSLNYLKFS